MPKLIFIDKISQKFTAVYKMLNREHHEVMVCHILEYFTKGHSSRWCMLWKCI